VQLKPMLVHRLATTCLAASVVRPSVLQGPSHWELQTAGRRCGGLACCASTNVFGGPDAASSAALKDAAPTPALQPREVIRTVMWAIHKDNLDRPRARFGCEVALRFLAPTNPASRVTPHRFAEFLRQEWYLPLKEWDECMWEGDLVLLQNGREAYQQCAVRSAPSQPWKRVRWSLAHVPAASGSEWLIQSVFVQEPDSVSVGGEAEPPSNWRRLEARESGTPAEVVMKVMRAVRRVDEPYPLHGCEVAIRYCSPSNAASRLSPQGFQQYLKEPWYRIMTEWDEVQLEEEPAEEAADVTSRSVDVLVRRAGEDSWTIVNWQLSLHSGQWLTDSLTIT